MNRPICLAAVVLCVMTAGAQDERIPSDVQAYARAKRDLVVELLRVTHAQRQAQEMLDVMLAMLPEDVQDTLRETFKPDDMVREIIPVYEKYLSVEDLRGILAFYRSPVGQKLLQVQPHLTKDAMIVMKVYAERRVAETLDAARR